MTKDSVYFPAAAFFFFAGVALKLPTPPPRIDISDSSLLSRLCVEDGLRCDDYGRGVPRALCQDLPGEMLPRSPTLPAVAPPLWRLAQVPKLDLTSSPAMPCPLGRFGTRQIRAHKCRSVVRQL